MKKIIVSVLFIFSVTVQAQSEDDSKINGLNNKIDEHTVEVDKIKAALINVQKAEDNQLARIQEVRKQLKAAGESGKNISSFQKDLLAATEEYRRTAKSKDAIVKELETEEGLVSAAEEEFKQVSKSITEKKFIVVSGRLCPVYFGAIMSYWTSWTFSASTDPHNHLVFSDKRPCTEPFCP